MTRRSQPIFSSGPQSACPCCGQDLPESSQVMLDESLGLVCLNGLGAMLPPARFSAVKLMNECAPGFVAMPELARAVYLFDDYELAHVDRVKLSGAMRVLICELRRDLTAIGLDIESRNRNPAFYRLVLKKDRVAA